MNKRLATHLDDCTPRIEAKAILLRRRMHQQPELGWEEHKTQAMLMEQLLALGLSPRKVGGTGLLVELGSGARTVLYRADIDALPLQDCKSLESSPAVSEVAGVCHACGHDIHTAIAMGLIEAFKEIESELPGRLRFVFQPAEELLPSGGERLMREGVGEGVVACLALHCDPMRAVGRVGLRSGPMTAAGDTFEIVLRGKGGHASRPYLARNPLVPAAQLIAALHGIVSQRVDPMDPSVITVTRAHAGNANNVIPDQVVLGGTVRSFNESTRARLHKAIEEVTKAIAEAGQCEAALHLELGAPCLINDAELGAVMVSSVADALGEECIEEVIKPSTGSEDFSCFAAAAPTYMARLGVGRPGVEAIHLHAPGFDPDESSIGVGMRVMGRALLQLIAP